MVQPISLQSSSRSNSVSNFVAVFRESSKPEELADSLIVLARHLRTDLHTLRKLYEHAGEEFIKDGNYQRAAESFESAGDVLMRISKNKQDSYTAKELAIRAYMVSSLLYHKVGDKESTDRVSRTAHTIADKLGFSDDKFRAIAAQENTYITSVRDSTNQSRD